MVQKIWKYIFLIMCVGLLTGCTPETGVKENSTSKVEVPVEEEIPKKESVSKITIGMQNPVTLNPIFNMDKSVQHTLYLLFDTLVNIEEDGSVTPNLAESFTYSAKDKVLIVKLREDIKWQDGTPLTSEDVLFTLDLIKNATESPYKLTTANIANVQAMDRYTFKIFYRQDFSGVYQTLFFPVLPKHIYNVEKEQQLSLLPIGNGPYMYKESVPHKEITLEANPNYFKGEPTIKNIQVMIIPDEESLLYAFEQGLIDVIYTDVMEWGKYAKDKSATIYEIGTNCYEFMGLNFNKPIFQNAKVREALVYGIDRQKISDTYYLGHSVVTDTLIAPYSYLFDPTLQIKEYNMEKAKLLLVGEGYQYDEASKLFTKNNVPLSFNLLVNEENKERLRVAEYMQKMYKELGIEVNIDKVAAEVYKERIYNKQFDAFLGGWKISYIPDVTFAFHSSQIANGDNFISYSDQMMDDLIRNAFTSHPDQITEAYGRLQQYIAEQNPYISLYFKNGALITKKKIGGNIQPNPINFYSNIEEWKLID